MNNSKLDSLLYSLAALLLALIPWQIYFKIYKNWDTSLASVLELGLFLLLLFKYRKARPPSVGQTTLTPAVSFFWATMLLSIFFAADFKVALKYGIKWSSYLFLYYLFSQMELSLEKSKRLILIAISTGFILASLGIIQFIVGKSSLDFITHNHWVGLFIEPDTLKSSGNFTSQQVTPYAVRPATVFAEVLSYTAYLGLIFPFCASFLFIRPLSKWWDAAAFSAILITGAIYFTQTRSAYLALASVLVVFSGWAIRTKRKILTTIIILSLIGGLALGASFIVEIGHKKMGEEVLGRIKKGFSYQEDTSASHRIKCWLRALEITNHYPILGIGIANTDTRHDEFPRKETPPHNNYYLISSEQGVLGLIGFWWLLVAILMIGSRFLETQELASYGLGFIGLAVWLITQSFFGHYFTNDKFAMLFWSLLGLLTLLERQWQILIKEDKYQGDLRAKIASFQHPSS